LCHFYKQDETFQQAKKIDTVMSLIAYFCIL